MHKMRKKCAQNAQECDKDAQKMASQKVPQIVAKSVPVLNTPMIAEPDGLDPSTTTQLSANN